MACHLRLTVLNESREQVEFCFMGYREVIWGLLRVYVFVIAPENLLACLSELINFQL